MKTKLNTLLASVSVLGMMSVANPALAQEGERASDGEGERILVLGRREAIETALEQERAADALTSIVTSDDIGNFGDPSVAESLQRISGVSINRDNGDGQQISIRGLPTEFATVTLDGARLGTSDPEINSTSLDFFSADNLSAIEVTKTLLPSMDADAIAGSVNLKTISAFARDEDTTSFRVEGAYQDKADAWNPKLSGDFTRIIELTGGGRLGLAAGATWQQRDTLTDEATVDDGLTFFVLNERSNGRQEWLNDGDAEDCQDGDTILECYLIPLEMDFRSEERKRELFSLNGQVEYEFGQHLFALRGSYADNSREEYVNRATFDFSRSDGDIAEDLDTANPDVDEVVSFGATNGEFFGVFEDGRAERRLRPGDQDETIWTLGLEGTSDFGELWTANYGADFSSNEVSDSRSELRFRSDNITMDFRNGGQNGIDIVLGPEVFDVDSDDPDPLSPDGWPIRTENVGGTNFGTPNGQEISSEDRFTTFYGDLERQLTLFDRDAVFSFGAKYRERERSYDFTRIEYLVDDDVTLADFQTTPFVDSDLYIPIGVSRGAALSTFNQLVAAGRVATEADRGTFLTIANLENDYTANEEVLAGYFQLQFQPTDRLEVIAGLRVEQTDYSSTGSAVRQLNYNDDITDALEEALENGGVASSAIDAFLANRESRSVIEDREGGNDYTELFPSVSLRWDVNDNTVVRASYTEGIKRPEYREATAIQFLNTVEQLDDDLFCDTVVNSFGGTNTAGCDGFAGILTSIADAEAALTQARAADGGLAFETEADPARNPFLDPLTSQNWDASINWYPSSDLAFSIGVFYKKIDNFIVPISLRGADVQALGFPADDGTETSPGITVIDTFVNGDEAEIQGLELNYYQAYRFLPAPFDGLFAQANATFADSSASSDLVDRDFQFPDQSDLIGNVSVGWENDVFSLRGALVYQGERLRGINEGRLEDGDDTAGDLLEEDRTQIDLSARWFVRDGVQVYFDAINITDAEDNRYFRGSRETLNGALFQALENYGSTYQIGVRVRY